MTNVSLIASAPFATDIGGEGVTLGVVASYLDDAGVATVQIRRDGFLPFAERVATVFGVQPLPEPCCVWGCETTWIGVGPGSWLAIGPANFPSLLLGRFGEWVSIADQSSGYVILHLTGPKVRQALAKLLPIDLHPKRFTVGSAASSVAAHIGVTLWRCSDSSDGNPVFGLASFRSFSASLMHSLRHSAAEFGFRLRLAVQESG